MYYPAGQKFARNRSISYGFRDIHTFSFSAKIQDGRQKWRKLKFFPFALDTLVLPCGQKFARNRSISYSFRDIHTFSFSAKIQDGHQKWQKLKFFPFALDTLLLPCGSKIHSKSLYLVRFSRYSHFFIFRKNPRWPPKVAKIEIFPLCKRPSCTTLRVKNSVEIALSRTVFEIFTFFHFPQKFQDGRQKWRKLKFFPFAKDPLVLPCGSKIRSKLLYLLWFSRYSHFFIFCKNPRWPPKF